jgi:hypothetical protein
MAGIDVAKTWQKLMEVDNVLARCEVTDYVECRG